jgi:predicted transposase/invertase (TIGR01784 family)
MVNFTMNFNAHAHNKIRNSYQRCLTPEEMNEYQQSLKIQRDNYSVEKAAKNEGREEVKRELAREMLADNVPIDQIVKYAKLSIEEIESL